MDILPHRHFKMKRITQVLPRRAVISRAGSGAEKSHSSMVQVPLRLEISRLRVSKEYNTFSLIPTRRSARDDVASPYCHLKMKRITQVLPRRAVISRARSGAWKSPSPMVQAPWRREISRLRVSKEYNTFSLIPTRRSARDDVASPYCHLKMKRITQVLPRRAVISRAGSGAKKSPSSMVQAPLRLEISRLRVSMMINTYTIHSGMPLRSR